MAVTACQTPYSCHEALLHNPDRYGLVMLSQRDLALHGLQESLRLATPSGTYRSHCSVVVHGVAGVMSDADLRVLKEFGVDGVLSEPFSLKALKVLWVLSLVGVHYLTLYYLLLYHTVDIYQAPSEGCHSALNPAYYHPPHFKSRLSMHMISG